MVINISQPESDKISSRGRSFNDVRRGEVTVPGRQDFHESRTTTENESETTRRNSINNRSDDGGEELGETRI